MAWERLLVLAATVAVLGVNALAGATGLHGATTGEVARRFDLPFTPAGFTFSVWGLIYLALLAFTAFQLAGPGAASARSARVRPVYVFSCVANVAWLWFWHHDALLPSLVVMLLLLASLADVRRRLAGTAVQSPREAWCLDMPFELYLAWISVATLANVGVVAVHAAGPAPLVDPVTASWLLLAASAGLAVFAYVRLRAPLFLSVVAWAMVGVAFKGGQLPAVAAPAMGIAVLAGLGVMDLLLAQARLQQGQSRIG